MKVLTPRRSCALCDQKIKYKERLCPEHQEEYKEHLTEPWLRGIIEESNYQYNVARRDIRTEYHDGVVPLDSVSELELSRGKKI